MVDFTKRISRDLATNLIKGHSGCTITRHGDTIKKGAGVHYSSFRLYKQYLKHRQFEAIVKNIDGVAVPKVYGNKPFFEPFFYSMEYIPYNNVVDMLEQAGRKELVNFVNRITALLNTMLTQCYWAKWSDVKPLLLSKLGDCLDSNDTLYKDIEYRINYTYGGIPVGICHGDLTMTNIFYKSSKNLVLLDFLDSFVESPLIDIAKLRQDTKFYWCLEKLGRPCDTIKVKQSLSFLDKQLVELMTNLGNLGEICQLFLAINLARILPYTTDKDLEARIRTNICQSIQ